MRMSSGEILKIRTTQRDGFVFGSQEVKAIIEKKVVRCVNTTSDVKVVHAMDDIQLKSENKFEKGGRKYFALYVFLDQCSFR